MFQVKSKASSVFYVTEEDILCAGAKLTFYNKLCAYLKVAMSQAGAKSPRDMWGG